MTVEDEELEEESLNDEQIDYLLNLLMNPDIDESDAELVLVYSAIMPKMFCLDLRHFSGASPD